MNIQTFLNIINPKKLWFKFLDWFLPNNLKRMMVISAVVGYISRASKDFEELVINVSNLLNTTKTDPKASLYPAYMHRYLIDQEHLKSIAIIKEDGTVLMINEIKPCDLKDKNVIKELTNSIVASLPKWCMYDVRPKIKHDVMNALNTLYIDVRVTNLQPA